MIRGSCLCGGVGSAYIAGLLVDENDFRLVDGKELIKKFEAPLIEAPPAYQQCFCSRCGCPVPNPTITDALPQMTKQQIKAHRARQH